MFEDFLRTARVLLVDDQPPNIALLRSVLTRMGFSALESTTDSRETVRLVREFAPDIILLDLNMPHLNGVEVLQLLADVVPQDTLLPILVLTGETSTALRRRALATGATDLLSKPFDTAEVLVRIRNLLKMRFLNLQVQGQNAALEVKVTQRTGKLEETLTELKSTQAQLLRQARLHAFSEMAGGVVHDFNNTLMAVVGYSELLLSSPELLDDKETLVEFLRIMNTSGRDAAQVVSRLRDFYRPRDICDVFTALDLNEILERAVPLTQPKWKDQALAEGRTIQVQLDLEKVPLVSADEAELRSLVTNLIFNAADALPKGGTITLRSRRCGKGASIEITDDGTGMTEEVRTRCLEPFFSTKGERGTGLGLSMVFGVVKRHHATLELRSAPGRGTTFTICFPATDAVQTAADKTAAPETPLQILVVDDEPVTRDVVARYLRLDGHTVTTANDASDALYEFARGQFDLLLTDHAMPGMNGVELATAARVMDDELPVILLTGFSPAALDKEQALQEVDVIIGKPVPQAALRRAIAEAQAGD